MSLRDEDIVGIAIFNDDESKMEVVVDLLRNEFDLEKRAAINLMLKVHDRGFAVIETLPRHEAIRKLAKAQSAIGRYAPQLILRIIDDPMPVIQNIEHAPPVASQGMELTRIIKLVAIVGAILLSMFLLRNSI